MCAFARLLVAVICVALTSFSPGLASAAPISFDCDVPADRYSSVSQDTDGPLAVSGVVELVAARSGAFVPVAGARLVGADGKVSAGFQIVALNGPKSSTFDVVLNLNQGGALKQYNVTQIDTKAAIPFWLTLDGDKLTLAVGDKKVGVDFVSIPGGKMMIFCSTGQFKFSDVRFGASEPH